MLRDIGSGIKALVTIPGMKSNNERVGFGRNNSKETQVRVYTASVWAYRCAKIIANSLSIMPWGMFMGDDQLPKTHPAVKQMDFVNETDNLKESYRDIAIDYNIFGYAIWRMQVVGNFMIRFSRIPAKETELLPTEPELPVDSFQWTRAGRQIIIPIEETCYFRDYGARYSHRPDSPYKVIVDKARSEQAIDATVVSHFEQYGIPPYLLSSPQNLSDKDMQRYKGWWDKLAKNVTKRWKAFFVGGGLVATRLRAPIKELSLEELRKAIAREVCAAMGVPPAIAGAIETANRATWRQQLISMQHHTVAPLAGVIEGVINAIMQPFLFESPEFKFLPEKVELLQEERSGKSERIQGEVEQGIISIEAANKELGYTIDMLGTPTADSAGNGVTKAFHHGEIEREWKTFQRKAIRSLNNGTEELFEFRSQIIPEGLLKMVVEGVKNGYTQN